QPKIRDYNRKDYFEYAGAAGGYLDKNAFAFCAGRMFYEYEEDLGQYNDSREVFWASGASLFIDAEKFNEVEGLDVDFFAHMEEIDLCWRLKNRGYRIGYCADSTVYHVGGGTLNQLNPFKTYLNFRNNLFLITKNHFSSGLLLHLYCRLILDGVAALRFLSEGNFKYLWAVLKAHISFFASFGKMYKKRKLIQQALHNPNLQGKYKRNVLFDFFLKKHKHFSELDSDHFNA
ncbi:MAG: GT2 family glycosyltransferase, partial [Flavobacteriales bacterium]